MHVCVQLNVSVRDPRRQLRSPEAANPALHVGLQRAPDANAARDVQLPAPPFAGETLNPLVHGLGSHLPDVSAPREQLVGPDKE